MDIVKLKKGAPITAERFFRFDPGEHEAALGMEIGAPLKDRLNDFAILREEKEIIKHIAGLYWLQFCLYSGALGPESRLRHRRANELMEEKTAEVAEFLSIYLMSICAGELRHGSRLITWRVDGKACEKCKNLMEKYHAAYSDYVGCSRERGYEIFYDQVKKSQEPTFGEAFELLLHGFADHEWSSGAFGGKKWGYVAFLAMKLFVAWAEGNQQEMIRNIDFIVHAVHNGGNCLYAKFGWYSPGNVSSLPQILTAKLFGNPCCWDRIGKWIPEMYQLVKIPTVEQSVSTETITMPACGLPSCTKCPKSTTTKTINQTCSHMVSRNPLNCGVEEGLFCSYFRQRPLCGVCGKEVDFTGCNRICNEGGCVNFHWSTEVHEHICPYCHVTKHGEQIGTKTCDNVCQTCEEIFQKELLNIEQHFDYWKNNFRSCSRITYYRDGKKLKELHKYCHACGSSFGYNTIGKVTHQSCNICQKTGIYYTICTKTGKCFYCYKELKGEIDKESVPA